MGKTIRDSRIRLGVEFFTGLGRVIIWLLYQVVTFWKIPARIRKENEKNKIPPYKRDLEQ